QTCDFATGQGVWADCVEAPTPCTSPDTWEECSMAKGEKGAHHCIADASGASFWTTCAVPKGCKLGATATCTGPEGPGSSVCVLTGDGTAEWGDGCATPIVISFDGAPVTFLQATGSFDLFGRDASIGTDWVSAATPWLAFDRDGNGRIDD